MTGPDDSSPGCTECRQPPYDRSNVPVTDIAEHAADENKISRESTDVGTDEGGVALHHLDLVRHARCGRPRPGEGHQLGVELDQAGPHVGAPPMTGHHVDHVPPLPGADAHDADRPGCV